MQIPRIVIAGERSGVGKSTITVGLLLALRARGIEPQPFKTGPDFLDPMHHSIVLGKPSRNLDTWMFGPLVKDSFIYGSRGSAISVIEGVMGLYDGVDGRLEEGSTAHLAKVLKAPVVLVLDASASARSVGAVALGFKMYDPDVQIAGVIFNGVGSKNHLGMLRDSLRDMECLGGIPRTAGVELESRHLGLVPASERYDEGRYEQIRSMVEQYCDVDRIAEIARSAPELGPKTLPVVSPRKKRPKVRIGVAQDEAFNFYYADNFDHLRSFGAEIVPFSPLRDPFPEVDGLYFGGGFPELYSQQLEENATMRQKIKEAAQAGMPIYAECGGMMYACQAVSDFDGNKRAMCGIVDAEVEMTERLQAIGYVELEVKKDNMLAMKGWTTRGHEFHYSKVTCSGETDFAYEMKRGKGIRDHQDGFLAYNTLASYTHLHFASCPDFARRFVDSCLYNRRR